MAYLTVVLEYWQDILIECHLRGLIGRNRRRRILRSQCRHCRQQNQDEKSTHTALPMEICDWPPAFPTSRSFVSMADLRRKQRLMESMTPDLKLRLAGGAMCFLAFCVSVLIPLAGVRQNPSRNQQLSDMPLRVFCCMDQQA